MAGALIGEAFLSASIRTLCDKVSSGELVDFFRRKKLDHSLLEKLKLTLLTLHAVLNDAEEKQIVNHAVGMWLDELKHAVFDAEDLLDEIDAEVLRSKVEAEYQTKKTQVWNFLSTSLNPFYKGMNGRVQVIFERLEHLAKQKDLLGLIGGVRGTVSQRTPTTSFVEHEFSPCGRDGDKDKLKRMLLSDDASSSHISVIPIVGMGGVGKTTLAQLLYNDKNIKEHFDVTAWACVSEDFDAMRVTKTLIESIISKPCSLQDSLLQVELREQVSGKKFLFVLDDLWNDNYSDWDLVRAPFTYGARGSKVIVTTRNKSVASIVHTGPIHYLKHLSDNDCWSLLAKHAFRNENPCVHLDLEEIGKQIARKCNGLPLAAKALGGLLGCNVGYKEWSHILNNNLWETLHDKSVLPSLRLSYHYLPTYLKQCFSYFSIFPKDFEFEKENIIQLWMALGLIPQAERGKGLEELGERYFDELLSRSLLQRSWKSSSFTMHDLINDLAMSVSGEFCFRLDEGEPHEVPKRVRHLSYMRGRFDTTAKFKPLEAIKCLRTLFPMSVRPYRKWESLYVSIKVLDDLLPALKCLRVLSLARYKNITRLPDNIGKHLSLRYIDLSYTAVKTLPNTMCELYNLQTLLLLGCSSLVELPADMRKLINLRLLDIRETCIKEMPVQMGRLQSLRTLTTFVVGKSTRSSGIGELGQLSNLGGKLSILNLQNVVNPMDALGANLMDKKDLHELELGWGSEDANDSIKERQVLQSLQPSVNLVKLTIRFYGGTSFPDWLGDRSSFSNIQVMHLRECSTCLSLPPVGRLPALKELYIERMKFVVSIGVEFYGGNGASPSQRFQSLKKLEFKEMPEWEEWLSSPGSGQSPDFPRLEILILENCPKLRGNLPDRLPCLRQLTVSNCGVLHERATRTRWIPWSLIVNTESLRQSLQTLDIIGCPGLSSLIETESLSSLRWFEVQIFSSTDCLQPHFSNCLQSLSLVNCASLLSFPRNGLPTSLTYLKIENCRRLEFLSHEMMAKLTSLRKLRLWASCDSLRSFPLGVFPKLSFLYIWDNKNLESLAIGEGADDENLTHLNSLLIRRCPNLVSFPHGGLPTPKLTLFSVDGAPNLKLLPDRLHTLTALRDLSISSVPNVESFAEGGLPPNLETFEIRGCEKLRPSVEYWGLQRLGSLRTFRIRSSEDLLETVLQEQLLPTTLQGLEIFGMNRLKSLEGKGLQHLTCLQELEITSCRHLEFLPKEGLPASLSFLSIEHCPRLRKRCQKKKGQEWSKIAHIPFIKIDDQFIV